MPRLHKRLMTRHQGSKASSAPYKQRSEGVPRVLHQGMRCVCVWPTGMRLAGSRAKPFPGKPTPVECSRSEKELG